MIKVTGAQHSSCNAYTGTWPQGALLRIERTHNDFPGVIITDTVYIPFDVFEQVEDWYKEWREVFAS